MWCTVEGDIEGAWIQYEFETLYQFHQIHVWNYNGDNEDFLGMGIKDALIKTSLDGETWSTYAQVELSRATGENDYLGEDVDMNDVVAQYLRIEILSQHGYVLGGGILVDQVGLSEVQFNVVPIAARRPDPQSGTTLESPEDTLVWRSGRGVQEHRLYLDVNEVLVRDADPNTLIAVTDERRYGLGTLDLLYDQKYYWRVDEVYDVNVLAYDLLDDVNDANIVPGPVWDFNTPVFSVGEM